MSTNFNQYSVHGRQVWNISIPLLVMKTCTQTLISEQPPWQHIEAACVMTLRAHITHTADKNTMTPGHYIVITATTPRYVTHNSRHAMAKLRENSTLINTQSS